VSPRAIFVSDIHIASASDEKCKQFLRFLDKCQELLPEKLFLVGDIFDLWLSDRDHFVSEYSEVVERMIRLRDSGVEIHYFEGNHDLDLIPFWRERLGFRVHSAAEYFDLGGITARVEHGDQMDPSDRGYLFLRWLLRTPLLVLLMRHLPNSWIAWIGRRASQASRRYTSSGAKRTTEGAERAKMHAHARAVWRTGRRFDLFVSGHIHVWEDGTREGYRGVNLGTWLFGEARIFVLPAVGGVESGRLLRLEELD